MKETIIPNVLLSISFFEKEAEKTIENKNTKAVKEAARKLKKHINKVMEYSDYGQFFVFHKFVYDNLEEYLLFLDWVQTIPKIPDSYHLSIIFLRVQGLLKVTFPLEKSIKEQEEEIVWEVKRYDFWGDKAETAKKTEEKKSCFQNLFEDSEDIRKENDYFDNEIPYTNFRDIINEKYENVGGELILKSRLNPGIKLNIRRDYKL